MATVKIKAGWEPAGAPLARPPRPARPGRAARAGPPREPLELHVLAQTAQVVTDWTEIYTLIDQIVVVLKIELLWILLRINGLAFINESRQDVDGEGQCPGEHPARLRGTNQTEVST